MAGVASSLMSSVYNASVIYCTCKLGNDTWILDSGASDHMSFKAKVLNDLRLLEDPVSVSLPNGHKVRVTNCGKLSLNDIIELCNVLLVPHFKHNLLSDKKLTSQLHCQVVFSHDLCTL